MPIGSNFIYNSGDLIVNVVSASGNTFQETKINATTSSVVLFDSNGKLTSASLATLNVGTSSFLSGSSVIATSVVASSISSSAVTASSIGPGDGITPFLIKTNGVNRMSISSSGAIGFGTTPGTANRFTFNNSSNDGLGSSSLFIIETNAMANTGSSANNNCLFLTYGLNGTGSNNTSQFQNQYNVITLSRTGSYSGSYRSIKTNLVLSPNNTGSISIGQNSLGLINAYFSNVIDPLVSGGSIPRWYGGTYSIFSESTVNTVTSSITDLYYHYTATPFSAHTATTMSITNGYGYYCDSVKTATNPVLTGFGFYQNGTLDRNLFRGFTTLGGSTSQNVNSLGINGSAGIGSTYYNTTAPANGVIIQGNVGIGTTSPATALTVVGTISSSISMNSTSITSSVFSGSTALISSITSSNISASGTSSVGILSIGCVVPASNYGILNISGSGVGGNVPALRLDRVAADTSSAIGAKTFKAWVGVYIAGWSGSLSDGVYYIPVYQ